MVDVFVAVALGLAFVALCAYAVTTIRHRLGPRHAPPRGGGAGADLTEDEVGSARPAQWELQARRRRGGRSTGGESAGPPPAHGEGSVPGSWSGP